jgi:photosystem II P680 reaction center D1 protein
MLGVAGGWIFILSYARFISYLSLIRETTENESANEGYKFGQEEETYNIVAAHGYFGRLIPIRFNNSRSLHFFLAAFCCLYLVHCF